MTIVDFAASWCGPCRRTLPRLQAWAERHPNVDVLVISVDDEPEGRDDLVSELGLTLPVLWDEGHEIAEHYRPPKMPTSVLLAPDGRVLHVAAGSKEQAFDALEASLESFVPD